MSGRLRTARELADQLGVVPATVLRWTREGKLPAYRMPGGAIRYDDGDIAAWLLARATGATAREAPTTQTDRAHGSVDRLLCEVPTTSPPKAAEPEEDPHAR